MAAEHVPCVPWADPETFTVCEPGDVRPEMMADAVSLATQILYGKTGRRFPGPCPDVWRPTDCGRRCLVHSGMWCTCHYYPAVQLRFGPVTSVTEVKVDGVVVPSSGWRLGDPDDLHTAGWLFRIDGEQWPSCQDIALAVTEPGTWQITYPWGDPPPAGADYMTQVLACEFVKAWTGGKCRLGGRFTSITRENLTATRSDPAFLADAGLLGIPEVDAWVSAINPGGVDRPPKILNPDLMGLGHDPTVHHRSTESAHPRW